MSQDINKLKFELAENYGGYTFDHGVKVKSFLNGFDAAEKIFLDRIEKLNLQIIFLIKYYDGTDTGFKTMMDNFHSLSDDGKLKIIELTRVLRSLDVKN